MTEKKEQTSNIEKLVFGIARVFTIICVDIAIIAVIILVINLFRMEKYSTHISLSDIKKESSYGKTKSGNLTQQQLVLSPKVTQYFKAENLDVLNGWISSLNKEKADDFLDNLSLIIEEADKNGEDVTSVINEYKNLKLKKIKSSKFDKYEAMFSKGVMGVIIFGLILSISLMILLLIALSIERNIRELRNNLSKKNE